jgi:hypothetical protein
VSRGGLYIVKLFNSFNLDISKTLKYIFENSEEKPEHKEDANLLFKKLIKLEYSTLISFWKKRFGKFP